MASAPYKIVDYEPGVHTKFEAFEDYLPNENWFAQAPSIQFITHTYRAEAPVRSAMVQTGEADWAADIGFEEADKVPKSVSGKTAEVYTLVFDTVFHEELAKQKVRLALSHAVDCQTLLDSLFNGRIPCHSAISMRGTIGINDANSMAREYNPELARQLLEEAGYDPENEININTRPGSNIRGLELMEATINYWRDIGVNANLNSTATWARRGTSRFPAVAASPTNRVTGRRWTAPTGSRPARPTLPPTPMRWRLPTKSWICNGSTTPASVASAAAVGSASRSLRLRSWRPTPSRRDRNG